MNFTRKKIFVSRPFGMVIKTAKRNIPIAKLVYAENTNGRQVYGKAQRSVYMYDTVYGEQIGVLNYDLPMEASYGESIQKIPFGFKDYELPKNYIICSEFPKSITDIGGDHGKLGYVFGESSRACGYPQDTEKIGTVANYGSLIVLYGIIPKGSKYIQINNLGKYYKNIKQYAAERIIIFPYKVQKQFTKLTGYDNVDELSKSWKV